MLNSVWSQSSSARYLNAHRIGKNGLAVNVLNPIAPPERSYLDERFDKANYSLVVGYGFVGIAESLEIRPQEAKVSRMDHAEFSELIRRVDGTSRSTDQAAHQVGEPC